MGIDFEMNKFCEELCDDPAKCSRLGCQRGVGQNVLLLHSESDCVFWGSLADLDSADLTELARTTGSPTRENAERILTATHPKEAFKLLSIFSSREEKQTQTKTVAVKKHMRTLPNPGGPYLSARTAPIVVREEESGALMAYFACIVLSGEVAWQGKQQVCIAKRDGTVLPKAVAGLRKIFPEWDGLNPFDLETIPMKGEAQDGKDESGNYIPEFELADCFHDDSYTPPDASEPVIQFKANWINPIGGSTSMPEPMSEAEKKASQTKWGSKFRALQGSTGKPAAAKAKAPVAAKATPAPAAPTKPAAPTRPPTRPTGPGGTARTLTQEEAWTAIWTKMNGDGVADDAITQAFYDKQEELFPGANGDLKPAQWGEVATALGA